MTQETPSPDQGSFLAGFSIGLIAGAVGYFLFATDKGEKVRDSIQEEWESAQKRVMNNGGQAVQASIRDLIKQTVDQVMAKIETSPTKKTEAKKKDVIKKAKSGNKFKGV